MGVKYSQKLFTLRILNRKINKKKTSFFIEWRFLSSFSIKVVDENRIPLVLAFRKIGF
ncbi:hypothetical protein AM1BK_24330 [Neobacillus kokaensis]|uniref:Uncharacterized protein n=1 Tax=Neobacillus kokaensis TaxID=2759023 RepID=A0ABQ3N8K3_9BACI|nr:hypothetical protein AM1BK_24330 [Neobacillus kokaensis]